MTTLSTAAPTLKCDFKGIDNSTPPYINTDNGILTADELAFAGGIYSYNYRTPNSNYLTDNAGSCSWTMTGANNTTVFYSCYDYSFDNVDYVGTAYSIRPVVVISGNIIISSGNGTQSNPYVIS